MTCELLWAQLRDRLQEEVAAFPGVAGVCLQDLRADNRIALHADEVFPVASTIKIPILLTLLHRAERKDGIGLAERVAITEDMHTPGSGVLAYLTGPVELTVQDIAQLMIMASDNTATNLCIDWAGLAETNALMQELGLPNTQLRRKMQDYQAVQHDQENVSTPAEGVQLMQALRDGRPSRSVADLCLSMLMKPNRGPIERALPPDVRVANKPGGMPRVRCDLGIVWLHRYPFALAVMTKFGRELPYEQDQRVTSMARLAYDYMALMEQTNLYGQGLPTLI